ncbi:flavoprotein [Gordoniibacillus kamchatkensis]|uniref:Flavoprotein n=1 Tax=Gordoniibacillus kamchatkensis TaxID=1590651 RepID=A0ABR5ACT2_9BACL|nr:NADPH-dependent FMN reductase [Paenibacillus sp. VKM B-2647]KIL38865.1 flavoprotein [Paenibacillus sp. VKM B-2647]
MDRHGADAIVLGISGSLREQSSNSRLLSSIRGLLPDGMKLLLYDGLGRLPHFSPDLDGDDARPHEAVREWREQLQAADAVVICTPEYARGVPGSLKNALDWVVSSGEFLNKPTAVISASPHPGGGSTALASLMLTLNMMSASIPPEAAISIPFVSKKLGPDGNVIDAKTLTSLRNLVQTLIRTVHKG